MNRKSILITMVITLLFLFNGCVLTQGYPSDLTGNLEPINKDDSYQKVIEQQQTSNGDKSKKKWHFKN